MKFFGQEALVKELWWNALESKKGNHHNFLFVAQSGYGKTTLAMYFANWVCEGNYQYLIGNQAEPDSLNLSCPVIIIDEIHTLEKFEWLYPFLDAKENSFVFCTNEYGDLPEPFLRRCFLHFFAPYSEDDYYKILRINFEENGINLPENLLRNILSSCKKSPGYVVNTCNRLSIVFKNSFLPNDEEELNEIMANILGIKNGLDLLDRRYLESLESLGGTSGIERIVLYSKIPRKIIEREIEPYLLENNKIEITTKGRKICS